MSRAGESHDVRPTRSGARSCTLSAHLFPGGTAAFSFAVFSFFVWAMAVSLLTNVNDRKIVLPLCPMNLHIALVIC